MLAMSPAYVLSLSVKAYLTVDIAVALVCALMHSLLDYCNVLFAGFPVSQLAQLQSIMGVAAHLILGLPGLSSHAQLTSLAQLPTATHVKAVLAHIQVLSWPGTSVTFQVMCANCFSLLFSVG